MLERYAIIEKGQAFELQGRIMHELFYLTQIMLSEVAIKIKLFTKNSSFFLLPGDDKPNYSTSYEDVKLRIRYVKINPKFHAQV